MIHENHSRKHTGEPSSDRSFGLLFTLFSLIVSLAPLRSGGAVRWWGVAIGAVLLLTALGQPSLLSGANRAWHRFGEMVARVANPLLLTLLFWGVIVPYGLILRLFRPDPLATRFSPDASSYWKQRDEGRDQGMTHQF